MRRKLVLTGGPRERELQLVGRIVVGRDPGCEISHDDSLLSRRHAEFVTVGDTVTVRDLGSRNGVFVNGGRAIEQVLEPGDVVQIGPLRAQFVVEQGPIGITPEEIDGDRTAVIRKAFAAAQAEPGAPLAAAVATIDADDEDVTRMVPAPRLPSALPPIVDDVSARAFDDGDEPTAFIPASEALAARAAAATPPAEAERVSSTAIFIPVLTLAGMVLVSAAVPLLIGGAPLWLAMSAVVAFAGSYLVSSSIQRRLAEAVTAAGRNGSREH